MRIYIVKHPEISIATSILYYKSLEILSGEVLAQDSFRYTVSVDTSHSYSTRYKEWRATSTTYKTNWISKDHANISCPGYSYYITLEQAIAAKLLLLSRLHDDIESKLAQVRDSLLAGTESVDELLEAHKDQYPEFFM